MIKGIIFDFGGVVTTDPSLQLSKKEAQILKTEPRFLTSAYHDEDLKKFEEGIISNNLFWKKLKKKIEKHLQETGRKTKVKVTMKQIKKFQETLIENFKLQKEFKKFITKLKRDYKIALLTNNLPSWMPIWKKKFKLRETFPLIITSFEEGISKPDPKIFLIACRKLNLKPGECLFIDDQLKNIRGAEKAGLNTIQFTTEKGTITAIRRKLKEQASMLK